MSSIANINYLVSSSIRYAKSPERKLEKDFQKLWDKYSHPLIVPENKSAEAVMKAIEANVKVIVNATDEEKSLFDQVGLEIFCQQRYLFHRTLSYAIPSRPVLKAIADFIGIDTCLEVGAGLGLWAYLIREFHKVKMIVTDNEANNVASFYTPAERKQKKYCDVLKLRCEKAIKKFSEANVLMIVWAPYNDPMATNAIEVFKGDKIVWIGEDYMGCTGGKKAHELLFRFWKPIKDTPKLVSWPEVYDDLFLYEKRTVPLSDDTSTWDDQL